jgi:hypothetical protein
MATSYKRDADLSAGGALHDQLSLENLIHAKICPGDAENTYVMPLIPAGRRERTRPGWHGDE